MTLDLGLPGWHAPHRSTEGLVRKENARICQDIPRCEERQLGQLR